MKQRLSKSHRQAMGNRIREIRKIHGLNQIELAKMVGLSQAILSQYEKGVTEASLSFIKFVSDTFEVSAEWLIHGTSGSPSSKATAVAEKILSKEANEENGSDFIEVPVVDPYLAAAPGTVRLSKVTEWHLVRKDEFGKRENLVALELEKSWVESMHPPLRAGSRVILDRDDKKIQPEGYFAINGRFMNSGSRKNRVSAIRRLNLSGSRLWLIEDEPAGDFQYVDLGARVRLSDVVVGRVLWIGQKLL